MARWRVTAKHYINARIYGEPTQWVREETNRDTGRAFRRTFDVPLYIDPEDPLCINKNIGYCVVATEGSEMPGDIVLLGVPTPDMEPLDDEARKITESERPKWKNPIDSLPVHIGEDFGQQLLNAMTAQFNTVAAGAKNTSLGGASSSEIEQLRALIMDQQKQITALMGSPPPVAEEPLPELDLDSKTPPPTRVQPRRA